MEARLAGRAAAALLAAATWPLSARTQAAPPGLTSAPYDLTMFRDGETRRMRARYGRWTVVCDEIIRMRSRYCSLAADVEDMSGGIIARLDVSTDDGGRPTALVHLPNGTLFDRPILVAPIPHGRTGEQPAKSSAAHAIRATTCDGRECSAVWALAPSDFDALNRDGLMLTYRMTDRLDSPGSLLTAADVATLTGLMPSDGFATAIAASLHPGPLAESSAPTDGSAQAYSASAVDGASSVDGLGLRR